MSGGPYTRRDRAPSLQLTSKLPVAVRGTPLRVRPRLRLRPRARGSASGLEWDRAASRRVTREPRCGAPGLDTSEIEGPVRPCREAPSHPCPRPRPPTTGNRTRPPAGAQSGNACFRALSAARFKTSQLWHRPPQATAWDESSGQFPGCWAGCRRKPPRPRPPQLRPSHMRSLPGGRGRDSQPIGLFVPRSTAFEWSGRPDSNR